MDYFEHLINISVNITHIDANKDSNYLIQMKAFVLNVLLFIRDKIYFFKYEQNSSQSEKLKISDFKISFSIILLPPLISIFIVVASFFHNTVLSLIFFLLSIFFFIKLYNYLYNYLIKYPVDKKRNRGIVSNLFSVLSFLIIECLVFFGVLYLIYM